MSPVVSLVSLFSEIPPRRVKQASTGYFYDLHMTRVHGGKTWMAPGVLIRQDVRALMASLIHPSRPEMASESFVLPRHCRDEVG